MNKPFLSPKNDVVFKRLFGDGRDIDLLTDFLQSTLDLPAEEYEEVTLADPHLSRENLGDKLGILDIKVKTRSGKVLDVEIQICDLPQMRERIVFYLARMITEQIGEGDEYRKIQRSICVLITDFVLVPENAVYHNRYTLRDAETGSEFSDLIEVDTLELPKLPRNGDGSALWDWLMFLNARSEEDLTMLGEKNVQVKKAVAKLIALSADEETRQLAESREKLRRDNAARMYAAEQKGRMEGLEQGLERGLEQGREQERLALARNALTMNLPIADIMALTGLSRETIQSMMH
ncbi:MAG: Rpn family recombination-promoting nuclease/putative transposase [Azoarcus sp.]|nr:Rpn family recombination-promoting nuclease/putative transposase [Azoarcus sp.]